MARLEERLSAALHARAHQIDEADLSPTEVPDPGRRRHVALVLAAAACIALVIGVPYTIAQLDWSKEPQRPPATAPPSPTFPPGGVGADWPISGAGRIDMDGDGNDESVRLRIDPTLSLNPMGDTRARVEVALPSGTVYTVLTGGPEFDLELAADLPGSDGQELLLTVGTALKVFDLVDGQLRELDAPAGPPLIRRPDNQGRTVAWMSDRTGLYSVRSLEPVTESPTIAVEFLVERWRWHVTDGTLSVGEPQVWCSWTDEPDKVTLCQQAPSPEWPLNPSMFAPDPLSFVGVGRKVEVDIREPGNASAVAYLVDTAPGTGDQGDAGRFELVVTGGGETWRAPVPAGGEPELTPRQVLTSVIGTVGFLVRQPTATGETWTVYAFWNGDLVAIERPASEPRPGLGRTGGGAHYFSWVQRGWMFTAVGDGLNKEILRWEIEGTDLLRSSLGRYCFDDAGTAPCE